MRPLLLIRNMGYLLMKKNWKYRRGDIYLVDLGEYNGSEQGGIRPAVVLQNNVGNRFSPTLVVAAITSNTWKKKRQPTHAPITGVRNLDRPSVVMGEQLHTINKSFVLRYIGRIPPEQMWAVDRALMSSVALYRKRVMEVFARLEKEGLHEGTDDRNNEGC